MADIAKKHQVKNPNKADKEVVKADDVTLEDADATPSYMLRRINALKNVQLKMVDLEAKFYEELHQLECKYAQFYEPLYDKRKEIVVGAYEPTEEEGKWALDEANMSEEDKAAAAEAAKKAEEASEAEKVKGVENFWLETLQSFRITAELIQEHDEPILAYLQDIRCKLTAEKPYGYTLEFHFAENPYFTDRVLTKTYELKTDVDAQDPFGYEGPDLGSIKGCTINWNAGKNVTVKMERRKLKSKNKKAPPRIIHKETKQDSFFNFFDTPKSGGAGKSAKSPATSGTSGAEGDSRKVSMRSDDASDADEEDQEELFRIADFEIGQYLREKVIPKAVLYYTGEYDGMEDDFEDYEDGDEEGDEDEDDEDEDDDDEDEDEDEQPQRGKKGAKGGIKPKPGHGKHHAGQHQTKGGEPTPSECKQN